VNYKEWETAMPEAIAADALWRVQAYRLALFACDIGWEDVGRLAQDRRTRALSDQLYRYQRKRTIREDNTLYEVAP
jgi:hypothetical protein